MRERLNEEALEYFRKQGARGGKLGAKARMEKLTPEKRSAIARNAVMVREERRRQTESAAESVPSEPAERSAKRKNVATKKGNS